MPEILQCRHVSESSMAASDLTVLDRQRARVRWQQQQSSYSHFTNGFGDDSIMMLDHPTTFEAVGICVDDEKSSGNQHLADGWSDLAGGGYTTLASPGLGADRVTGRGSGSKKRKADQKSQAGKGRTHAAEENPREKRTKGDAEDFKGIVEPKLEIQQPSNENSDNSMREASGGGSKENSKAAPPQKPDYIHVRARRGQATDSHSLAERVRREKISERMKYLQDLVPGCNKITGKAGMLDEIINYVQSLQRQVEFLSMKLAAVNPRLDFNIDHFFSKEINPACSTSFTAVELSSEVVDPSYLQFNNPFQQAITCCGLDMPINHPELALRRTASAPMSAPDAIADSCFNVHGSSFTWDSDLQSLNNMEFHQGRGFTFPFQSFQGNIIPNNPKMEL